MRLQAHIKSQVIESQLPRRDAMPVRVKRVKEEGPNLAALYDEVFGTAFSRPRKAAIIKAEKAAKKTAKPKKQPSKKRDESD